MGRPKKNTTGSASSSAKKILALDGCQDFIAEIDPAWDAVLRKFYHLARIYGFSRIETPLVEDSRLYENFYGDKAPVSTASFTDQNLQATVRAEILPSVLRAYYEHKVYEKAPLNKWSYAGVVVKKSGNKLVSDFQYGFEIFGAFNHLTEAQIVGAVWELVTSLGLSEVVLEINNVGNEACQANYQETLQEFLLAKKYELCDNCNDQMHIRPFNVFRCDNLDCQAVISEAPAILDFLDQDSHKHFTTVLEALDELGVPYQLNPLYVGPSGMGKTNFVVKYKSKGVTKFLGEGGDHSSLLRNLSGKEHSAFGFSGSLLTLYELMGADKVLVTREIKSEVFLVPLGELASKKSLRLFKDLTRQKISVYDHFGTAGVKNQLKQAETFKAPIALIMGQKEAMDEMVILRDVKSGMQEIISYDKIVEEVKKRLGR